jgi:beta-galactosidase
VPALSTIPPPIPKVIIPTIYLRPVSAILSETGRNILGTVPLKSKKPLTYEEMDQFSGFLLYETDLPKFTRDPAKLVIEDLRDRAYIFINDNLLGVLSRENVIKSAPLGAWMGTKLQLLVESQGRIDYQVIEDYKVLFSKK